MRKPFVGMSMKTYKNDFQENIDYLQGLYKIVEDYSEVELVYLPSVGLLHSLALKSEGERLIFGAQNIGLEANGPHTGEVSAEVYDNLNNVQYVELGHTERKDIYHETNEMIAQKVKLTVDRGMNALLCIGESEKLVDPQELKKNLKEDLEAVLTGVKSEQMKNVVLAYEPVWAIGQSESAQPDYIHNSHKIIREILAELYNETVANSVRVIYGGSVSKETVRDICDDINVDGVFVGRFGHDVNNLSEIVKTLDSIKSKA